MTHNWTFKVNEKEREITIKRKGRKSEREMKRVQECKTLICIKWYVSEIDIKTEKQLNN